MNSDSPSRPTVPLQREVRYSALRRPWVLPESQIAQFRALTLLESALTRRLLQSKPSAPVSPFISTLTRTANLYQSKGFKSVWFDTLTNMLRVTPLESALTKALGGRGGTSLASRLVRNLFNLNTIDKFRVAPLPCSRGPNQGSLLRGFVTFLPAYSLASLFGCSR